MLFYGAAGHMSVNMMRTGRPVAPGGDDDAPLQAYMSYAGTWRRVEDTVLHMITVAPNPQWVETEQVRELVLTGDRLTLYGTALIGPAQRRVLVWRRIG
jgi:hypothetical protein